MITYFALANYKTTMAGGEAPPFLYRQDKTPFLVASQPTRSGKPCVGLRAFLPFEVGDLPWSGL